MANHGVKQGAAKLICNVTPFGRVRGSGSRNSRRSVGPEVLQAAEGRDNEVQVRRESDADQCSSVANMRKWSWREKWGGCARVGWLV